MKRFFISLFVILLCFSCATRKNLPNRIDSFVSAAEASAKEKSYDDWEQTTEEYEALLSEFQENYDSYSKEEKRMVYEAIGRYNALLVKNGLEEMKEEVGVFLDSLQDYIEEIPDALNGLLDGIRSVFN